MSVPSGGKTVRRRRTRSRARIALATAALLLASAVATSQAAHLFSDTAGHSTVEQLVKGDDPELGYSNLRVEQPGEGYTTRDPATVAQPGREQRRRSLANMGQFTDFQLPDEESPARVEFLDPGASSAWRPEEALAPFIIEWSIRQMNLFTSASPVTQGDGSRAPMDFALVTGDQADSQQRNETAWVRDLLEGGTPVNFNSGSTDPNDYDPVEHPSCAGFPPSQANRDEALRYTGVQDYDDYDESTTPLYYDPDEPRGSWASDGWPTYPGLMDRAQQITITPQGLNVPSYVTNGNHDTLVQGNEDAIEPFEDVATGCLKVLASTAQPGPGILDPSVLLAPPSSTTLVPPDPERRYVSKPQVKAVYGANDEDNDHGFEFVDPAENAASNGSASYYAWDPPETPGFRFVSIDTVSEGGQTAEGTGACGSSSGNIDDPQFQWLRNELQAASSQDKLIVVFGHHPVRSMCADIADEQAQPCTTQHDHGDDPEHDRNPGCDLDPRPSTPIHLGRDIEANDPRESFVELLDRFPHVIAYVAGHTHENNIEPFTRTDDSLWWSIETSATADWPVQHRLIEVMDNRDGTLSIFGTVLDHAAAAAAPASGTSAAGFDSETLASIGRVFSYNDPQVGPGGGGEGSVGDRNVELLLHDPRQLTGYPRPQGATPVRTSLVPAFKQCSTPNSSHGAPLSAPSCNPSDLESEHLTVGSPDANGKPARSAGFVRYVVQPGNPDSVTDEADVALDLSLTDVRHQETLSDYAGELQARAVLRITDRYNGFNDSEAATTVDTPFSFTAPCSATADPNLGGSCNVATSADAVMPGLVREGDRAIWELGQIEVYDGGADGDAETGGNTLFARQGVFIP